MAKVVVKDGPGRGSMIELTERLTIGRAPDNDVTLLDGSVSRYHAVVHMQDGLWQVTDLDSSNGTMVNGRPVAESELCHLDEIKLGRVCLLFLDPGGEGLQTALPGQSRLDLEVTETIRLADLQAAPTRIGGPMRAADTERERLASLLSLAELVTSVKTLPGLLDGVAETVRNALHADRVVPVLRDEFNALRQHEPAGKDSAELDGPFLKRGLRESFVGVRHRGRVSTAVVCAPVRVGSRSIGLLYCERSDTANPFTAEDMRYLFAVAVHVGVAVQNIRAYERIARQAGSMRRQLDRDWVLIGESEPMQQVRQFISRAAPTEASVLIYGESGTGKELVARAIHEQSPRSDGPMEIINCAAVPAGLLESELFGHARGAFTGAVANRPGRFELADGGTLFLDEICELPAEAQTKLLRALEEGTIRRLGETRDRRVDVRILAATNIDPDRAVKEGRLRQDLFYRLDRLRILVPPLRERSGDIELLARHFLGLFARQCRRPAEKFAPAVLELFNAYGWPGNVRELQNVVERMVILTDTPLLGIESVPADLRAAAGAGSATVEPLQEVEKRHIAEALSRAGGNKKRAAQMLGIDRSTLYGKLRRYGIGA